MLLSKHITCNRFSTRILLGERASERAKSHVRETSRQRENKGETTGRREAREVREKQEAKG